MASATGLHTDEPRQSAAGISIEGSGEDAALAASEYLTREEVLRRRLRRLEQLSRYYRRQYWALAEEVRVQHRRYFWEYGESPCYDEGDTRGVSGVGDNYDSKGNLVRRCGFPGCKSKAMALTRYCHSHVLSDRKQKLYKPCIAPVRQVTCGKPILRAAVPSLCNAHLQRHQKNIWRVLKKGGLNMPCSSKPPNFSLIIAEYVRCIQAKRREVQNKEVNNDTITEEDGG